MKQFYTLLFIVITTFGFGQEYKFNLLTRYNLQYKLGYEFKFKEVNRDRILYSNIEDSSYFLIINKTSAENKAYITDLRTNKIHFLQFKEIKSDNDVFFTFEYLKTENLVPFEVNKNVVVEFETIKEIVYTKL